MMQTKKTHSADKIFGKDHGKKYSRIVNNLYKEMQQQATESFRLELQGLGSKILQAIVELNIKYTDAVSANDRAVLTARGWAAMSKELTRLAEINGMSLELNK